MPCSAAGGRDSTRSGPFGIPRRAVPLILSAVRFSAPAAAQPPALTMTLIDLLPAAPEPDAVFAIPPGLRPGQNYGDALFT